MLNIQIHDCSLSWFGTGTSIKSSVIKLILWTKTSPLSEMTWTCKCFSPLNNRSTPICNRPISVIAKSLKRNQKKDKPKTMVHKILQSKRATQTPLKTVLNSSMQQIPHALQIYKFYIIYLYVQIYIRQNTSNSKKKTV